MKKGFFLIGIITTFTIALTSCGFGNNNNNDSTMVERATKVSKLLNRIPSLSTKWNLKSASAPQAKAKKLLAPNLLGEEETKYTVDLSQPVEAYTNFRDADEYTDMILTFDDILDMSKKAVAGDESKSTLNNGWSFVDSDKGEEEANHYMLTYPENKSGQSARLELEVKENQLNYEFYSFNHKKNSGLENDIYLQQELKFAEGNYYRYVEQYSWLHNNKDRTTRNEFVIDLRNEEKPVMISYGSDVIKTPGAKTADNENYNVRYITFEDNYLVHYWFSPTNESGQVTLDDLWIFDMADGKPILETNRLLETTSVNLYKFDGWSKFLVTPTFESGDYEFKFIVDESNIYEGTPGGFAVELSYFRGVFSGWPVYRENPNFTYSYICEVMQNALNLTPKNTWDLDPVLELTKNKLQGVEFTGKTISELDEDYVSNEVDNVIPDINQDNIKDFVAFKDAGK